MSDSFDPYHKWLGISPAEQPPNHYRMLGVNLFETDLDVISNAADQRMGHVHSYQGGVHAALSQRILNEISTARVCLLDPDKKAVYDATLQGQIASTQTPPRPIPRAAPTAHSVPLAQTAAVVPLDPGIPPPPNSGAAAATETKTAKPKPRIRTRSRSKHVSVGFPVAAIVVAVLLLVVLVIAIGMLGNGPPDNHQSARSSRAPASIPRPAPVPAPAAPVPVASAGTNGSQPTTEESSSTADESPKTNSETEVADDAPDAEPAKDDGVVEAKSLPPDGTNLADVKERIQATLQDVSAREILETVAVRPKNDAESFAMLCLARDSAVSAGDPRVVIRSVEELDKRFIIDAFEMKVNVLPEVKKHTTETAGRKEIVRLALTLTDEAIELGRLDVAERCAKLALTVARETEDNELVRMSTLRYVKVRKQLTGQTTEAARGGSADPAN